MWKTRKEVYSLKTDKAQPAASTHCDSCLTHMTLLYTRAYQLVDNKDQLLSTGLVDIDSIIIQRKKKKSYPYHTFGR